MTSKVVTFFYYNSYRVTEQVRKVYHLSNSANSYCLIQNKCIPIPRKVQAQLTYSHGYATVENSVLTQILVDDETNPIVLTLSLCLSQIKVHNLLGANVS